VDSCVTKTAVYQVVLVVTTNLAPRMLSVVRNVRKQTPSNTAVPRRRDLRSRMERDKSGELDWNSDSIDLLVRVSGYCIPKMAECFERCK
jgi:hypothetical protein